MDYVYGQTKRTQTQAEDKDTAQVSTYLLALYNK